MFTRSADRVRSWLRDWLGIFEPSKATPALSALEEAQRDGLSIHEALLRRAKIKEPVRTYKFQPPKLPDGVVPRNIHYDASNDPGKLGEYLAADSELLAPSYSYGNQFACGLGFPGYPYLAELSQRSEYRSPAEIMGAQMTREFIKVVTKSDSTTKTDHKDTRPEILAELASDELPAKDDKLEEKVAAITEALEKFKVRQHLRRCVELDAEFGRAQLYIDIDPANRDPDEINQLPLLIDPKTLKKDSLRGFKVVEPLWTSPYNYNATNPLAADFYKPRAWYVMGKKVHASRLLTFVMREVADMLKPAYNFSGLSMSQLMETYVYQWLRTRNSVSDLVHNYSVMCLKTDMTAVLAGKMSEGIFQRAEFFIQNRDNQGLTLLDMKSEDLAAVNVPLSNLDKLQAQSQEHMAAASHIPLVFLLGIQPAGLNASSEGEIKVFYDFVRSCQQLFFADHLNTILQVIQLHLFGEIDDAITFEFVPLSSPTTKELSEIRKADAETDVALIGQGIIAPEEARQRLAIDPNSGYNGLSGEPPQPPQQVDAEHGHELNEEAATNAHERNLEAQKAESKNKAKAA